MTFLVELTSLAAKDLKRLSKVEDIILGHLRSLKTNPEKGHSLIQNLQGALALDFTIKGSGQYRAAYVVQEEEQKVTVFLVGPHENFYDEAAHRVKLIKALLNKARAARQKKSEPKKKKGSASEPAET